LFDGGAYVPLTPVGPQANHVFAFARTLNNKTVITIVPRLVFGLTQGAEMAPLGSTLWHDTLLELPRSCRPSSGQYRNVLTGESIAIADPGKGFRIADALASFPVALLE
jgi:(1->4)-alpha-D-glucan 1-alpha-D-glucosylmutase